MKKIIVMGLITLLFSSLASANEDVKNKTIGIWAMIPLDNGIANVVEFKADGTSYHHSFRCNWDKKEVIAGEVEKSNYTISTDIITITTNFENAPYTTTLTFKGVETTRIPSNKSKENDLKITLLELAQSLGSDFGNLDLTYARVKEVAPLCDIFFNIQTPPPERRGLPAT